MKHYNEYQLMRSRSGLRLVPCLNNGKQCFRNSATEMTIGNVSLIWPGSLRIGMVIMAACLWRAGWKHWRQSGGCCIRHRREMH